MKRTLLVLGMVVGLVGFMTVGAQAIPITGVVQFSGTATFNNPLPNASEILTFSNVQVEIGTQSGSYVGTGGDAVTYSNNFVFSQPTTYHWSINGTSFSFTGTTDTVSQGTNPNTGLPFVNIFGTGVASAAGYDNTPGTWSLTSQGNTSTLSFSAFTGASSVPEPATLLLLGLGLLGLGVIGLRWKRKA